VYLRCKGMLLCNRREKILLLIPFDSVLKILAIAMLHVPQLLFVVRLGHSYVTTYST
jgi:hypothetical protein